MTVSRNWMVAGLLLAVSVALPARAQEARKPDPPAATSAPVAKPVDPTEQQKREAARLLLLNGGKQATDTKARQGQSAGAASAVPNVATGISSPANQAVTRTTATSGQPGQQQVVYVQQPVDPVAVAQAEQIHLQNEAVRRQMDRDDTILLNEMDRTARFDEQQLAWGWQALDNDLANQYQNLAYQDQGLMANQIGLQSAITSNRQQFYQYKSWRQWDNLNRSMVVMGGSLGDLSAPAAGILNYAMHGHEDEIDRTAEDQFNGQQSAMMSDIDATRQQQISVRDELRSNLRMRMEALKARQAALRPSQQPTQTTTSTPAR